MKELFDPIKKTLSPVLESIAKPIQSSIISVAKYAVDHKSNMLTWTYLTTTIASSACQLISIKQNKNISEEKKKFLLPQEAIDAILNAGLFVVFTKSLSDIGQNLVDAKKIIPVKLCSVSELTKYKEGIGVLFGITGSIIATSIVTPFARNKLAAIFKNQLTKKDNSVKAESSVQSINNFDTGQTFKNTSVTAEIKTPVNKVKQPIQMNEFLYVTKNHLYKV